MESFIGIVADWVVTWLLICAGAFMLSVNVLIGHVLTMIVYETTNNKIAFGIVLFMYSVTFGAPLSVITIAWVFLKIKGLY